MITSFLLETEKLYGIFEICETVMEQFPQRADIYITTINIKWQIREILIVRVIKDCKCFAIFNHKI